MKRGSKKRGSRPSESGQMYRRLHREVDDMAVEAGRLMDQAIDLRDLAEEEALHATPTQADLIWVRRVSKDIVALATEVKRFWVGKKR